MATTDRVFEQRLEAALGEGLDRNLRADLDARVAAILVAPPRRRWFLRRRSLLVAAAIVLSLPLTAAAAIMSTEDPFGLADAGEFQVELDRAMRTVPLPPGRAWPDHLTADPNAAYSRGGARSWVEANAVCIWFDEWIEARATGDALRERSAAAAISDIPAWPSWNSPFWTDSVRDHLRPLLVAVDLGQDGPVRQELATNCSWLAWD